MKIGIIGVNGFIGRHLLNKLQDSDHTIIGFGRKEQSNMTCNYQTINLNDTSELSEKIEGIDLIYYLASESIPATSWDNPIIEIEKNLIPFLNLLEAAKKGNVKRVVFISSGGNIYGDSKTKIRETDSKNPYTPYGINKLTMEYYLNYYEKKHNIKHDIYRISNIYGEGQDISKGLGIINTFLENIITNRKISVFGDGKNVRNYIYINDVIKLICNSVDNLEQDSDTFNICSDDNISINEIIHFIQKYLTANFQIEYLPERKSDIKQIILDNAKIKTQLPDFKFTPLRVGLSNCFEHIEKKHIANQKIM